ncbi:nitrous oxide reductase family maturation protein NosD [Candidatus Lokiarchaeum ossiferum]|uniref:nitrous oxide reductase family maturation protein NosD n=1 Tax=Candidatus Lokiarchaeum ossiferum TaxID=2951803 RepID=UPI00352CB204
MNASAINTQIAAQVVDGGSIDNAIDALITAECLAGGKIDNAIDTLIEVQDHPNHHYLDVGYNQADLEAAITAASAGDVIHLPSGTCVCSTQLVIGKALTIVGSSTACILQGNIADYMISITTTNVIIKNLTIYNAHISNPSGITFSSESCSIEGCYIYSDITTGGNAIQFMSSYCKVINCRVYMGYMGIKLIGSNCQIISNVITHSKYGLGIYGNEHVISHNVFRFATLASVYLEADKCVVSNNILRATSVHGIHLSSGCNKNTCISNSTDIAITDSGTGNEIAHNVIGS